MFYGKFRYTPFDKRNDFSLSFIVKYPDLSENIPLKPSFKYMV